MPSSPSDQYVRQPAPPRAERWLADLRDQYPLLGRILSWARIDFPATRRFPSAARLAAATVVAVLGSLAVDAVLVVIGQAMFPSTSGYGHFRFADYGKLTVVGVLIACCAWPVVARMTSAPRWLFFRLAVLVTAVLYLPDLWLLALGQPVAAVVVLMVMHLAIAVVTYQALVRLAPPRSV